MTKITQDYHNLYQTCLGDLVVFFHTQFVRKSKNAIQARQVVSRCVWRSCMESTPVPKLLSKILIAQF